MADLPDWMNQGTSTQTASTPSSGSLPDWMNDDSSGPAHEAVRLSSGIAPDKAAQVLDLADKNKLPIDFVSRNADALQRQQDNAAITPQFSQDHPVVTSHMAEDPHQAALVAPDAEKWGFVERQVNYMKNQLERGGIDVERQVRGMIKGLGYDGVDNDQRIGEINQRLQGDLNKPAPGPISSVFGKAVESTPQMVAAMGAGALGSLAKVPTAAGTAATFGALEFGNAYLDFSNRKDATGAPMMTNNEARGFALISGAVNGAMFMVPAAKMLSDMPGLRMLGENGMRSIIESPTSFQALRGVAEDIGKSGLTMGNFSGLSSLVHSVSGHLGEVKGGKVQPNSVAEWISTLFPKEDLKAAAKSWLSGLATGTIFGTAEQGVSTVSDIGNYTKSMDAKDVYYAKNVKSAQETADGLKNIGNVIADTKMSQVAPEQVEKLVSKMAPDSHVFIPLEKWQEHFEGKKVDPRAAFEELTGDPKAYDEALRTGIDLQVPTAKYIAKISPTEHNEFLSDNLRSDPMAMSAEEATESMGIRKDMEKEEAKNRIHDEVTAPPEPTKEAQDLQGFKPLLPQPTAQGMSPDMAGKYREAIERATAKATDTLVQKRIDIELKQKSATWLSERADVQKDVESEIDKDPVHSAFASLKNRKTPDGAELSRLSGTIIGRDYPEMDHYPQKLPPETFLEKGGIHPDDAAMRLGYESGAELIHDLATMPDRDAMVKQMTDERMLARHPEVSNGLNIVDRAMESVHNEQWDKVLRMELQHLASDDFASFKGLLRRVGRPLPPDAEMKADAEREIGQKKTSDTIPSLYQRAASTAAREAQEHMLRGDWDNAFEARRTELVNRLRYRAALDAKEQAAKDMSFQGKFDSNAVMSRIGKAGGDYLEQIQALRSRFDFSPISKKDLAARESLRDWYDQQKAAGEMPEIPQQLLDDAYRKSWRDMTNDELHKTVDAMRSIDHLAGLKKKLLDIQDDREYAQTMQMINASMDKTFDLTPEKMNKVPDDYHPDFKELIAGKLNSYGGWRTRMEPLFRLLGGGEYNNPLYKQTYDRLNDAQDLETKGLREATDGLNKIFNDRYSKVERSQFGRLIYVPELAGSGMAKNLNRMEIMISLAHAACGDGMKELMRGYKVTESQLRAAWKHLDPRDIETVQMMHDLGGAHWEDVKQQARKYSGLDPEKVPANPLDIIASDGSKVHLDGGYFHLDYDQSIQARKSKSPDDDLFGNSAWQTMTKPDYEKARVGGGGQAPSLKLSAFTNNILDTVHNLSYRDAVTDLHKIMNDPDFKDRVKAAVGDGVYKQFKPWLKEIAGDRPWDPTSYAVDLAARHMTTATLGIKVTSAFVHTTSLLPAFRETKGYMVTGLRKFYSDIPGSLDFIRNKSEFMASFYENFDRDFRAAGARLNILNLDKGTVAELQAMSPDVRNFSFALMKYLNIGVAGPTWYGAYLKSMDGKVKNNEAGNENHAVSYADQLVRDTKGAGAAKDLSPILLRSSGSLARLATLFYTQLSVIDNQLLTGYRQFKVDRDFGKVAATAAMSWFGPAIASELIRGHTPKQDESWMWWGAKTVAKFPLETMFGAREVLNFFGRAGMDMARGRFEISPLEEAMESVLRTTGNIAIKNPIVDKLRGTDTEWSDQDYADAVMTAGYMTGLPTKQLVQSAQRLHGWMSGAEEHKNPIYGLTRVAIGAKKPE